MSPFFDAVLKIALIGFVIKFLWDGFVRLPQEKLEKQVEFLIARYASSILYPNPNSEEEIKRLHAQAYFLRYNDLPVTDVDNYTDENKEILDRVYKKIQANIKRDKELYE